jgi:hypothetical protein
MEEFVNTYLSKIDNSLQFKFTKRKEAQLKRVARLNALRKFDADRDFWDMKDLAGKEQLLIYGRAIFAYYADSENGYAAHLENVDVYDFLIDPSAGGIDMEQAKYLGRYGVVKDRYEMKDGDYITSEVKKLLDRGGNNTEKTKEESNKVNRTKATGTAVEREDVDADKFKFWEWFTTYEGKRYYLLMTDEGIAIRAELLTDIFPPTRDFPLGAYPFWSYGTRPSVTEFWTRAPADQVREIFMAQNVTINQMLDNGEEYNKPMKVVDIGAITNLSELKYRRSGTIRARAGMDVTRAVQFLRPPAIDTPLRTFDALESIQEKASGVTAGAKGTSGDDKVGIYEGNQANTADRFGLINKSYSFGYKRFAKLYEMGVRNHLTKKVSIEILGPDGVETEGISRRDVFKKSDEFGITVEASDAENQASEVDKRNKLGFLSANAQNPAQSPKKAYEIGAKIAGFDADEIKELLDTSDYGNAQIMSEASRDIEDILEGKEIKPNRAANVAYKKRFLDYMIDHEEDMTHEQFMALASYITLCEEYVLANTAREITNKQIQQGISPMSAPPALPQDGAVELSSPESYDRNIQGITA